MPDENRNRKTYFVPILLLCAAMAGLFLSIFGIAGSKITWLKFYQKLMTPLAWLLVYLGLGLLVGQAVESFGWTMKLAQLVRPLTRWGHLKDESGAAFISSFVSGILANSMLMTYYNEGKITKKEMILTYLLNNGLPVYLVHLPTTFFVVASLARNAGLIYLGLTFAAACIRTFGILFYTRFYLPTPIPTWSGLVNDLDHNHEKTIHKVWKKFKQRFFRVVAYTIPIYVLVFLAVDWGFFLWLRKSFVGLVSDHFFPIEAAGIIIFALAAEFSSGMAAAGALLDAGTLTIKQTTLALILGTIIATPLRAIRHQLPTYAGLFNLSLAGQLLFLSQALRIISLLLVTLPFAIWL